MTSLSLISRRKSQPRIAETLAGPLRFHGLRNIKEPTSTGASGWQSVIAGVEKSNSQLQLKGRRAGAGKRLKAMHETVSDAADTNVDIMGWWKTMTNRRSELHAVPLEVDCTARGSIPTRLATHGIIAHLILIGPERQAQVRLTRLVYEGFLEVK